VSTLLSLGPGNVTIYNETLVWDPGVNADVSTDNITIGPSSTFNLNGNKITFANPIGGGGWGGLTVDGPGRLTLAANNTYTGGTAVSGATLVISDWSGLAGGYGVQSNGTLVYAPDANDTLTINPGASGGTYPWGSGAFDTAVRDADAPADITYPWGNSTYRVKLQSDGSWVIPALGLEIQTVSSGVIGYIPIVISGYEITAWPPPAN
jgi:autotransporter-associated beta strand protein